ncbi:MAG: hypothetical protein MUO62_18530 [Anaerolineales bacterium]|nr:hypothetical protein [Anaerolineales bacterium]
MDFKKPVPSIPLKAVVLLIFMAAFLSACRQASTPEVESPPAPEAQVEQAESVSEEPTQPPQPTETPLPPTETPLPPVDTPTPEPTPTPGLQLSGLSADPQRVAFSAQDGKNLVGYYYPAKYASAPVIVLMHWARGDQRDWCQIAPWLQNRKAEAPAEMPGCGALSASASWWDPSWFPLLPEEASFAVFTFDFRDFGESEAGMSSRQEWAWDAQAAFATAAGLEGVDPPAWFPLGPVSVLMGPQTGAFFTTRQPGAVVWALSPYPPGVTWIWIMSRS